MKFLRRKHNDPWPAQRRLEEIARIGKEIQEVLMNRAYLIIVRKDEATQQWIVDDDSAYILDRKGGYPVLELQVHTIRALAPTPEEVAGEDL